MMQIQIIHRCWISFGENQTVLKYGFLLIPVWTVITFVTVAMVMVYRVVLKQENRMARYSLPGSQVSRTISKEVATQALWYLVPFYITWVPPSLLNIFKTYAKSHLDDVDRDGKFVWILFVVTFVPLQGLLNFLVYLRPRFLKWYKANSKERTRTTALQTQLSQLSSSPADS